MKRLAKISYHDVRHMASKTKRTRKIISGGTDPEEGQAPPKTPETPADELDKTTPGSADQKVLRTEPETQDGKQTGPSTPKEQTLTEVIENYFKILAKIKLDEIKGNTTNEEYNTEMVEIQKSIALKVNDYLKQLQSDNASYNTSFKTKIDAIFTKDDEKYKKTVLDALGLNFLLPTNGGKGGKSKQKVKMSSSKAASKQKKTSGKRKIKGGAEAGGMDMNAVYNVSGLITSNNDVLGTALKGTDALLSVHQPFGAGSTTNVNSLSVDMMNMITPQTGRGYYGGGKAPAKKAKAAPKKKTDLKRSQKEKAGKKKK